MNDPGRSSTDDEVPMSMSWRYDDAKVSAPSLIIVGMMPSEFGDPNRPCMARVGIRLQELADPIVLLRCERCNLNFRWMPKFSIGEAMMRADLILARKPKRILALGREVSVCFGFKPKDPFLSSRFIKSSNVLLLPHPSTLNRWWNDEQNVKNAKVAVKQFLKTYDANL